MSARTSLHAYYIICTDWTRNCVWMCFLPHIRRLLPFYVLCVCVLHLSQCPFLPFIHAILVLYNCVCMSLHVLLCVVCMVCSVVTFEWLSHVLWCHKYYCTGLVWFSRNFVILENYLTPSSLPHSTHLLNLFAPSPSGWQHCSSSCRSQRPQGPTARAVWELWSRRPAQE